MFDHASGRADHRHRVFFQSSGELCQVWAHRSDGQLFYLADGAVDDQIRTDGHAGRLSCPYPGCPDPRFIAKGGPIRRHHFAHKIAGATHSAVAGWRHQALLMLADWCARRYPQLESEIDDQEGSLRLRSRGTGREMALAVTYDPRRQAGDNAQLLVGHSRRLLLPRQQIEGQPEQWWCGKGRLVADLIARCGWALAINPQERLIATLVDSDVARTSGITHGRSHGELLCIVDDLDNARLAADGVHSAASDLVDKELARRKAAEEARKKADVERAAEAARTQARISAELALVAKQREAAKAPLAGDRQQRYRSQRARVSHHRASVDSASVWERRQTPSSEPYEQDWPRDLPALRALLDDQDLAPHLEQPLATDAECGQPAAVWHLMAALEFRKRNYTAHPLLIRAVLTGNGCSVLLTKEAIEPVLAIVNRAR